MGNGVLASKQLRIWLQIFGLALCCQAGCSQSSSSGKPLTSTAASQPSVEVADASANPGPAAAPSSGSVVAAAALPAQSTLVNATYNVTVEALGLGLCTGTAALKINSSLTTQSTAQLMQIPSGSVTCNILGTVNLGQILGAFSQPVPAGSNPIVIADNVLSLTTMGNGTYSPSRPLLPAFFVSTPAELSTLHFEQPNITISTANGTDTGSSSLNMVSYDQPYTSTVLNETFPRTLDFITTNAGFPKTDRIANFLFDSIEMTLSTTPVAVVHLVFQGPATTITTAASNNPGSVTGTLNGVSQFISSNPLGIGSLVSGVLSTVNLTVTMELASQDGLAAELATANADSGTSIGEQIGGQPVAN